MATNAEGQTLTLTYEELTKKTCIWLLRQDQLQEMLNKKPLDLIYDILGFMEPDRGYGSMPFPRELAQIEKKEKYVKQFTSLEQLWLASVMEEKYNKVWNGKDWVKETKNDE